MITEKPLNKVIIQAPERAGRGKSMEIIVRASDNPGRTLNAVVPAEIVITDPDGDESEFSGYYGMRDGMLKIKFDIASNDAPGAWTIAVRELASRNLRKKRITVD